MNFIFPKNYNYTFKFLGMFSYFSIFINVIWGMLVYFFISILFGSFIVKLYAFIILFLPVCLFTLLNKSNENILLVLYFLIKYIVRPKVFYFDKRF